MKKVFIIALMAITSLSFSSCKKSAAGSTSSTSQWTLKGVTYKSTFTPFTAQILQSSDASDNSIAIYFSAKPTAGGTFTVSATSPSANNECSMIITNSADSYYSTGKAGDKATVTVSSTGEVTVVFSGVTVLGFDTNEVTTASGSVAEND